MARLPTPLVSATANPHKLAEIEAMLGVSLVPRPADLAPVVEDAGTLLGNARLKARAVATATGLPAISDDTGLFVDALDGEPGVDTAYFAGPEATAEENRALLVERLRGVADRRARFCTVVVVAWPDGRELVAEGVCEGSIAESVRGAAGFGYDALFVPAEGDGRTFAEMTPADKQALSHRGRAFSGLRNG